MSGSISGGQNFSWLDYLAELHLSPTTGLEIPTTTPVSEEESVWLSKSDQEMARDIAALMLLPPTLSPAAFQALSINFPDNFSITNVAAGAGNLTSFGATETGITLAAAFSWARTQNQQSALVQLMLGGVQTNPLQIALTQFVNQAEISPVDAQNIQLLLRQMPVLCAVIRTVEPSLVLKAFSIAEQQLVLSLLDKWVAAEQAYAEASREAAKERDIKLQQAALEILRSYFSKVSTQKEVLSAPVISTIIGSLLTSSITLETASLASPFISAITGLSESIPLISNIAPSVQALLGALSLGLISASSTWATPVSMALIKSMTTFSPQQATLDAAKAYAVTLSSFLMNPAFESFISSQLQEAVAAGLIDESQASLLTATFRTSLLIDAMASLYRAETGGVTGAELLAFINDPSKLPEDSYLRTLITLINESLKDLPQDVSSTLLEQLTVRYDSKLQNGSVIDPISSFITVWGQNLSNETASASPA